LEARKLNMLYWWPSLVLFLIFLRIGAVSFGGAYSIWALVRREFQVETLGADTARLFPPLHPEALYHYMEIGQLTPGPNINGVLLVGNFYQGLSGMFIVLLGLLLPSVVVIILLYHLNQRVGLNQYFHHFKVGALAAIIGVLTYFLITLAEQVPRSNWFDTGLFIFQVLAVLYLVHMRKMNAILVTFLSGMVTWSYHYWL